MSTLVRGRREGEGCTVAHVLADLCGWTAVSEDALEEG